MKLFYALMSMTWTAYAREVQVDSIPSSSKLGQKILSQARLLENNNNQLISPG